MTLARGHRLGSRATGAVSCRGHVESAAQMGEQGHEFRMPAQTFLEDGGGLGHRLVLLGPNIYVLASNVDLSLDGKVVDVHWGVGQCWRQASRCDDAVAVGDDANPPVMVNRRWLRKRWTMCCWASLGASNQGGDHKRHRQYMPH